MTHKEAQEIPKLTGSALSKTFYNGEKRVNLVYGSFLVKDANKGRPIELG